MSTTKRNTAPAATAAVPGLTARIITPDLFFRFLSYMPNPDDVLQGSGEAITVYREMKTDPRIVSLLRMLKTAIVNHPLRVVQGESHDDVFGFVRNAELLRSLPRIARRMLGAVDYGFQVAEVIWENGEGWWKPVSVETRKPERFAFSPDGGLMWRRLGTDFEKLDQRYKWLTFRFDEDAENPYGTSVLQSAYWSWKFKKAGLEFWLMATERFSVPSLLAIFEHQGTQEDIRARALELSRLLTEVSSGSGAAMANVKDLKALEATGSLEGFRTLIELCDTQIAYAIAGASLAVQEGQNGTRAQATVHEDLFEAQAKGVARDLQPVLQELLDWMVELNFGPGTAAPRIEFDLEDYATFADVTAAIDRGVPVSREALYSRYGLPRPADAEDTFEKPAAPSPGLAFADEGKKKALTARPHPRQGIVLIPRRLP